MSEPAASTKGEPELDELTLRRAQRGDGQAFRALVARYHVMVHALIFRMVEHRGGGAHRVEELTQETFLRVFRGLGRFDPSGPARLSTWVLTIATRVALNELRRPAPRVVSLDAAADEASSAPSGEAALDRRRVAAAVRSAIAALDPDHRAVLVLREYHDLEYAEIAEALDLNVGTVRSRLSRARAALRQKLAEVRHG